MALPDLLHQLTLAGFTLAVCGCNDIEVRGPLHQLTQVMKKSLLVHKPLLLAMLQPGIRCPRCGSDDLADGKYWTWCLTCEERVAIQEEYLPPAGEALAELVAWFARREQGAGIRLLASGKISESPQVNQTRGDSDPTP